jgi:toxin ParE1/3/4
MTIVWSPEAIDDLRALRAFIAEDNPVAAQSVAGNIIRHVEELLPRAPQMGRAGRVPGTRELVIPGIPYIVPYRVRDNVIQVLRVYHAARRWPQTL